MQRDERTFIRVHDGMPDHPKVEGLSDKAFRLLVESWCWSKRHLTDGYIREAVWSKRGTAAARRELVSEGLAEPVDGREGGVQMHDFTDWQETKDEVATRKAERARLSARGNHTRWHVERGVVDPGCPDCIADSSRLGSGPGSRDRSRPGQPRESLDVEVDVERTAPNGAGGEPPTLIDLDRPPAASLSVNRRAQALAKVYAELVPLSKFPAVMRICKQAIDAGYDDTAIEQALRRIVVDGRPVTVDVLRLELEGPRPKASTTDQRVRAALDLRDRLRSEEAAAAAIGAGR